jgi:hypothetical protein
MHAACLSNLIFLVVLYYLILAKIFFTFRKIYPLSCLLNHKVRCDMLWTGFEITGSCVGRPLTPLSEDRSSKGRNGHNLSTATGPPCNRILCPSDRTPTGLVVRKERDNRMLLHLAHAIILQWTNKQLKEHEAHVFHTRLQTDATNFILENNKYFLQLSLCIRHPLCNEKSMNALRARNILNSLGSWYR